jgi:queuine tRNA-ribosyltransferase
MPLDVCLGADATRREAVDAAERTRRWAVRSAGAHRRSDQHLFGIVQGGLDGKLRRETARDLCSFDFPGYAIGGLSVGESPDVTEELVRTTAAELPVDRPRYLMGVGTPEQVLAYSALGVDMFDCVLPTRLGRTGVAFGPGGRLNLKRAEFKTDCAPIDLSCDCRTCDRHSRAILHAMLRVGGTLAARLISLHNCRALVRTAESVRSAVLQGTLPRLLEANGLHRLVARAATPDDGEADRAACVAVATAR